MLLISTYCQKIREARGITETIKSDLRFEIDRRFREEGVRIPFPQRDLHIVSDATKK